MGCGSIEALCWLAFVQSCFLSCLWGGCYLVVSYLLPLKHGFANEYFMFWL